MTKLWRVDGPTLTKLPSEVLDKESSLEDWLEADVSILDPNLIVIGRQLDIPAIGRLDLLAMDSEGVVSVVELKRHRTPRDIVAQVLDYASWITRQDTPAVYEMAERYWQRKGRSFAAAFSERFGGPPPEPLNTTHNMVIVASALDPASQRIVEYLSQVHNVGINTAFFTIFADGDRRYLAADWLMDQEEVVERIVSRIRAPWSGLWYVNAGESEHRSWEDMRGLGFISAGYGRIYSQPLNRLSVDDTIYVYQKGRGYVGVGIVTGEPMMARDAIFDGLPLLDHRLVQPGLGHDRNDPELAEYIVPVKWLRTVPVNEAKTFDGAFANQHIVCRLRDRPTIEFLEKAFGTAPTDAA
jgi:hypothetical protein